MQHTPPYQALLVVSFGGPEKMDDVMPFLDNVLRGRPVPEERKKEVAHHYELFDGVSPINQQNRALIAALRDELARSGIDLPIYWGNRNWKPYLVDTLRQMGEDGIGSALAFFTSGFSCYSGCRQYRENICHARAEIGSGAPRVDKLRMFFNHPGFIEANADRVQSALEQIDPARRADTPLVFTAHSLPQAMAERSDYELQLREAARLVAGQVGRSQFDLVYQSRSGPPQQPWLEPDICDHLKTLRQQGHKHAVISPVGFISDHMEVVFDLDTEAMEEAAELGMQVVRAGTAGTHPAFISMIRELIEERLGLRGERRALGALGPWHDVCPENCCLPR